jgi:hypothetical protein
VGSVLGAQGESVAVRIQVVNVGAGNSHRAGVRRPVTASPRAVDVGGNRHTAAVVRVAARGGLRLGLRGLPCRTLLGGRLLRRFALGTRRSARAAARRWRSRAAATRRLRTRSRSAATSAAERRRSTTVLTEADVRRPTRALVTTACFPTSPRSTSTENEPSEPTSATSAPPLATSTSMATRAGLTTPVTVTESPFTTAGVDSTSRLTAGAASAPRWRSARDRPPGCDHDQHPDDAECPLPPVLSHDKPSTEVGATNVTASIAASHATFFKLTLPSRAQIPQ